MASNLAVITCSTRPGRIGGVIAQWFIELAKTNPEFNVVNIDLQDFNLPLFDEPNHPKLKKYIKPHTQAWSAAVDAADAFVFVSPEYNGGPPGTLVNALNFLYSEWNYKPAGFISYGGISGGGRAVGIEKQLMMMLKMVPILEGVSMRNVSAQFDAAGKFTADKLQAEAAINMISELSRWSKALSTLR